MAENMMCPGHKATNDLYRDNFDRTFNQDGRNRELLGDIIVDFYAMLADLLAQGLNDNIKYCK